MKSAAQYRAEAAKCRALAKHVRDELTANNLLALAADYDEQAEGIEPSSNAEPPLPTSDLA